jgi:hypothetical protein
MGILVKRVWCIQWIGDQLIVPRKKTSWTYFKLDSPNSNSVYIWGSSSRAAEDLLISEFQLYVKGTQCARQDF